MMGADHKGESSRQVILVPHSSEWRGAYHAEAHAVRSALPDLIIRIHHIGSTAIQVIYAKPVIDILLEVTEVGALDKHAAAMQSLGYEAMGEYGIPGRRYFRKNNEDGVRTYQVHAFQAGSPQVERHLAFRDYMIEHPALAAAYGALKQALAKKFPNDIHGYTDGKDAFIKEHEARALDWRQHANPVEDEAAH
jgi:GrpB-like predicted nucleotidyltransferase (UPF0157 family)